MEENICQAAFLFLNRAKCLIFTNTVVLYVVLLNPLTYVQNIYKILI